ncbi:hypothetical protein ACFYO7_06305 [Nocardia salmonicida]|uniref:hypothetical protein n=1 Tax=Nocardia salmonicida TaxID=53431 RepID=UPI0036C88C6D
MSQHNKKVRTHTTADESGPHDEQGHSVTAPDTDTATAHANGDTQRDQSPPTPAAASVPPDGAVTDHADTATPLPAARTNTGGQGLALIGPTSEATRRWVAESRMRQGLSPRITDPAVIESLVLFLRNTFDSLDRDRRRDGGGGHT